MKLLLCFTLGVFAIQSHAESSSKSAFEACLVDADTKAEAKKEKISKFVYCKNIAKEIAASGVKSETKLKCDKRFDTYQESRKEATEKCGEYLGGGPSACMSKMAACSPDTSADDAGDSISTILTSLGLPNLKQTNAKCPQFTSEVLQDRLDGIEENLKESTEKVTKLTETIQEARKGLVEQQGKIEAARIGNDHAVIDGQITYMAKQREIAADSKSREWQLERDIDRAHGEMLKAQGEMARAVQEKNKNLISLKRRCDDALEVERAKKQQEINEYRASGRVLSGGIGAKVRIEKYYENLLKGFYTRCIRRTKDDRRLVIDAANKQTKLARQQMRRAENEMNRIKDAINVERARARAAVLEQETRSSALAQQKRKENELAYSKLMQMQTEYTNVQNQITTQIQTEQQQQMMTKIQLSSLKAKQPKTEITTTPNQVRAALGEMASAAEDFVSSDCCPKMDGKKRTFASEADSRCKKIADNIVEAYYETHDLDSNESDGTN